MFGNTKFLPNYMFKNIASCITLTRFLSPLFNYHHQTIRLQDQMSG